MEFYRFLLVHGCVPRRTYLCTLKTVYQQKNYRFFRFFTSSRRTRVQIAANGDNNNYGQNYVTQNDWLFFLLYTRALHIFYFAIIVLNVRARTNRCTSYMQCTLCMHTQLLLFVYKFVSSSASHSVAVFLSSTSIPRIRAVYVYVYTYII